MDIEFRSHSESDTMEIARALGSLLEGGDVVALYGDLGAGKTVFCKGVGESLGISPERIVSPSFTIVTEHRAVPPLFHVDAYRLRSQREGEEVGLDELFGGEGVCLVEWADRVENLLPNGCLRVTLTTLNETGRAIRVVAGCDDRLRRLASRCERFIRGGEA